MVTTIRGFCGLMAISVFVANAVSAVEVRPPLENAITRALQKPLVVDFRQKPLSEAVQHLAAEVGLTVRIDTNALRHEEIDPAHSVTFSTDEQPVADTLDEILAPFQLDYDPRGQDLLITTRNQKNEVFTQRFFDVSPLVKLLQPRLQSIEIRPILSSGLNGLVEPEQDTDSQKAKQNDGPGGGFGGGFFGDIHKMPEFRTPLKEALHRFPDEYALMCIIQDNTSGQWHDIDGVGGSMMPALGRILMRQTEGVQREAVVALTNIEMMLRDPKKFPKLRLGDDDGDRRRRAALDQILDTVSDVPAGVISLEKWIDENLRKKGVLIRVAHTELQDEGIDWKSMTISLTPGETRRKLFFDALEQAQLSLVYHLRHFYITSLVKADEALTTMVFDVSDLSEASDMDWLAEYLFASTSGQWEQYDGVGGTASPCGISGLLFVRQTETVLEEVAERLDDLWRPLEVPAKPLAPQRTRSIYTLPDVATATDLQAVLPKLVDLSTGCHLARGRHPARWFDVDCPADGVRASAD